MPMTRYERTMLRRRQARAALLEDLIFWGGIISMVAIATACAFATYQALTIY